MSQCKERISDSVSLTTSMCSKEFKRDRKYSASNSSDEENIPIKATYCDSGREQKEQQSPQILFQDVDQRRNTGVLQLPMGVQVVLIPKDMLFNSNTCAQELPNTITPRRGMNTVSSTCIKDMNLNQSSSSDPEPDSTMPCDTVLEVKITTNPKETNKSTKTTDKPQERALDLSAHRGIDQTENMWRPW